MKKGNTAANRVQSTKLRQRAREAERERKSALLQPVVEEEEEVLRVVDNDSEQPSNVADQDSSWEDEQGPHRPLPPTPVRDPLCSALEAAMELEARRRYVTWGQRAFALACALHPRLGASSPMRVLPRVLLHLIAKRFAVDAPVVVLGGERRPVYSDAEVESEEDDAPPCEAWHASALRRSGDVFLWHRGQWSQLPSAPVPIAGPNAWAFAHNGHVWVAHGPRVNHPAECACLLMVFSLRGRHWTRLTGLPLPAYLSGAAVCANRLILFGRDANKERHDVTIDMDTRAAVPNPFPPRNWPSASGLVSGLATAWTLGDRFLFSHEYVRAFMGYGKFKRGSQEFHVCDLHASPPTWTRLPSGRVDTSSFAPVLSPPGAGAVRLWLVGALIPCYESYDATCAALVSQVDFRAGTCTSDRLLPCGLQMPQCIVLRGSPVVLCATMGAYEHWPIGTPLVLRDGSWCQDQSLPQVPCARAMCVAVQLTADEVVCE